MRQHNGAAGPPRAVLFVFLLFVMQQTHGGRYYFIYIFVPFCLVNHLEQKKKKSASTYQLFK